MHNHDRRRSALRLAVTFGCLLLVISVFAWGLHAKLALYDAHTVPSAATVAKLLVSQKTGRELVVPLGVSPSADLRVLALALFSALVLVPLFRVLWLRPETLRRRPQGAPCAPTILSRPPPSFAGAR